MADSVSFKTPSKSAPISSLALLSTNPPTLNRQSPVSRPQPLIADPENVRVVIRLRPALQLVHPLDASASPHLVARDLEADCPYLLQTEKASVHAAGSWYTFDGVHPPSSSTAEIYGHHFASLIRDAVGGYNSTLFAYGATGSGKSYSMMGSSRDDGIVLRAIEDVFDLIEQDQEREYVVRVSYLEIYNEQLRDLLSNDVSHQPFNHAPNGPMPKIHEDRQGRIFVRPLVSTPCADPEEVVRLLLSGEARRRTERTEWNLRSSRSHAIFSLTLESRPVSSTAGFPITSYTMREATGARPLSPHPSAAPTEDATGPFGQVFLGTGPAKYPITPSVAKFKSSSSSKASSLVTDGSIRISQLNLVDLAGSEKLSDNEARNKEASYIKKSLLALQSVVTSLTELSASTSSHNTQQKHRLMHVPYRNSQLTRLLQTSLSGNAKVAFLCTISPDPDCEVETLSTLRFAAGAKKVVTKAELGQVVDRATLLEALESKVLELEAALLTNADYTEALERERDEAVERADGAARICFDYEAKLAELQTLRTPLKEQHDHLRRLILTGSPHSSYASQTTLEQHGASVPTTGIARCKSAGKRVSKLSEAHGMSSPAKKSGWRELLFDENPPECISETSHTIKENPSEEVKINELNLTIAKLEATIAEAEDTHLGEIAELKAEVSNLEVKLAEQQVSIMESHAQQLEELRGQIESLESSKQQELNDLSEHLHSEEKLRSEAEHHLREAEAAKQQLLEELGSLKKSLETEEERMKTIQTRLNNVQVPFSGQAEHSQEELSGSEQRQSIRLSLEKHDADVTLDGVVDPEDATVAEQGGSPREQNYKVNYKDNHENQMMRKNGVPEECGGTEVSRPKLSRKRTASHRKKNETHEAKKLSVDQSQLDKPVAVRRSARAASSKNSMFLP